MVSYTLLLQIELQHSYYSGGIMREVEVTPTPATQQILTKYKMITRLVNGTFSVHYGVKSYQTNLLEAVEKTLDSSAFQFTVTSYNQSFYNFTDIPIDYLGPLVFSSDDVDMENGVAVFNSQATDGAANGIGNIGIISIYPEQLFNVNHELNITNYAIELNARKVHWQYYVINRSGLELDDSSIGNGKNITFNSPEKEQLPTGDEALMYSSGEQEFAFSETSDYKFDLISKGNSLGTDDASVSGSNPRVVVKGLPSAQVNQINTLDRQGAPYVYSAIYVYV